jgi:hypothetical protein
MDMRGKIKAALVVLVAATLPARAEDCGFRGGKIPSGNPAA